MFMAPRPSIRPISDRIFSSLAREICRSDGEWLVPRPTRLRNATTHLQLLVELISTAPFNLDSLCVVLTLLLQRLNALCERGICNSLGVGRLGGRARIANGRGRRCAHSRVCRRRAWRWATAAPVSLPTLRFVGSPPRSGPGHLAGGSAACENGTGELGHRWSALAACGAPFSTAWGICGAHSGIPLVRAIVDAAAHNCAGLTRLGTVRRDPGAGLPCRGTATRWASRCVSIRHVATLQERNVTTARAPASIWPAAVNQRGVTTLRHGEAVARSASCSTRQASTLSAGGGTPQCTVAARQ